MFPIVLDVKTVPHYPDTIMCPTRNKGKLVSTIKTWAFEAPKKKAKKYRI